jgi:hypothetical protein
VRVGTRRPLPAVAAALLVVGVAAIAVTIPQGTAWADCPPDPVNPLTGLCATVTVTIPADPPPADPADPNPPAAPTCPGAPGGECQQGNAWWSSVGMCYAYPLDPQPPVGSAIWESVAAAATNGTLMACNGSGDIFYVPGGQNPIPDARTIALNAVKRVPFVTADVHTAPAPPDYTYVHLENWLWVPEGQWRTVEARAAVGGTAVTVTAEPSKIEWAMGDGYTKVCRNAGRAWVKGMTDAAKTSCGYAYDTISVRTKSGKYDPDGRFGVTAQFFYEVRWSCTGVCSASGGALGEYPGPLSPVTEVQVRQRQTVVTQ